MPYLYLKKGMVSGMSTSNINGIQIYVPELFSGILPVSPHEDRFDFEPYAFEGLKRSIKEGDKVMDLGASYGVMSALMAKMVGDTGKVYSFDANPNVIPYQNTLWEANSIQHIIDFHHFLITEESGLQEDFYIVDGFQSVASTINQRVTIHMPATPMKVMTLAIDDFKVVPNVIKLDVEGAEYIAVLGMERLLKEHQPTIVLETHNRAINWLNGGSLKLLMDTLEAWGYSFTDLNRGCPVTPEEYARLYEAEIGNVLCRAQ